MFKRADISLAQFRQQAQSCAKDIKIAWDATSGVREFFQKEEDICADQCDLLRESTLSVRIPVQDFCRLLDSPSELPLAVVPFRYSLIMALHRVDFLANDLLILTTRFREVCHTLSTSKDTLKRREEISRKLDEIANIIEKIPKMISVLLFQAHYHELGA
jgi:hypothetical protein